MTDYLQSLIDELEGGDSLTIKIHTHSVVARIELHDSNGVEFQEKVLVQPDSNEEGAITTIHQALDQAIDLLWDSFRHPDSLSKENENAEDQTVAGAVGSDGDGVRRPAE